MTATSISLSLRARLFIGLTAVILFAGLAGVLFTYVWAYGEAIELQDATLIQIGSFAETPSAGTPRLPDSIDRENVVTPIELGTIPTGSADDRQLWALQDGLHNGSRGGQPVRVLLGTRGNGSRFAIVQQTAIRDETARGMAFRTLLPLLMLIPCLLLVTAFVVARSLRPMARMAAELDRRAADDLTPLPLTGMASELRPFIASINGLFARITLLMGQQRRFVADAAHELRTPITALSLQADNLCSIAVSDAARERIDILKQGMRRTRHLLDQLLALARHDGAPLPITGTVALDQTAKQIVADLLPEVTRRNIDLGFELVEPVAVAGDPLIISSIVRNLVDNAARFTPDGGRIDVGVFRTDGCAVLQIEDSGPGIPPTDLDRIFEPFYRGENPTGDGSGLGLSIVKRIVDRLGGTIELENIAGAAGQAGLRATITLPAVA
jgi:two-component system, OmpR family, sensor kinase